VTGRATFWDFALAARTHLDQAAVACSPSGKPSVATTSQTDELTFGMSAVIQAMTRYLDDINAAFTAGAERNWTRFPAWIRAALEAERALRHAAGLLSAGPPAGTRPRRLQEASEVSDHLTAAAAAMRNGRDLLHTHFTTGLDGRRKDHSDWAPVITSVPVTRALLLEIGQWARQLGASGTAHAPLSGPVQSRADDPQHTLRTVSVWLRVADAHIQTANRSIPERETSTGLLHAIPVHQIPPRKLPRTTETLLGLCQGAVGSAGRVRYTARAIAPHGSWSPGLTVDSLRQSAASAAAVSHHCAILLDTLARQAARHSDTPVSTRLVMSAMAAGQARQAWLQAARAWERATTSTRGVVSPTAVETADLALWTGRLTYADPQWTLALGPAQQERAPEDLAPAPADLQQVLSAVHHASAALNQLAAADREQIAAAARTGRLLVPTRSLPESYDSPYPFTRAPDDRVTQILVAYHDAASASSSATASIADVAIAVQAPSRILAAAQAATQHGNSTGLATARLQGTQDTRPAAQRKTPGPVERTLQDLGVTNPDAHRQAAAIDLAAEQLILDHAHRENMQRQRHSRHGLNKSTDNAQLISHRPAADNPLTAAIQPRLPQRESEAEIEP
jgi:hypothetical protein